MKRDPIVLGKDYILSGDEIGLTRPNGNALIVGASGCGKSFSCVIPTICRAYNSNLIMSYAKEADGLKAAKYLKAKKYDVKVLNINNPGKGDICFDPILALTSYEDVDALASSIIDAAIKQTADDYWPNKAKPLLKSLIMSALMTVDDCRTKDVLDLFDRLLPIESGSGVESQLDALINKLEIADENCMAVREYRSWHSLPFRTASCVRDTLASALSSVFSESIREMMRSKPQFNLEDFVHKKSALIVITSASEKTQVYYANMFYGGVLRQLMRYAAKCPSGELPREVRFVFDDFACTAPIEGWANAISLFRSAGISAIHLLQSEQQLDAIYKDEAPVIRQNCAVYCYYPGGFDDKSCEIVSKRMNIPYEEVLYAPMGKVFVMCSGRKPVHIPRYDTLNSSEYQEYQKITKATKYKDNIR